MAAPRKYTPEKLSRAVKRYFKSITREVTLMEKYPTGEKDKMGHMIYGERPVINLLGKEAKAIEYLQPPTVGALSAYLGIHRSTWAEYCSLPEFSDTTSYAQGCMRAYLEQQLLTRKDVKGIIFDLQNNHGYSEKRQVELGERASKAVSASAISMGEKKLLLEQIAREFSGNGDTDAEPGD